MQAVSPSNWPSTYLPSSMAYLWLQQLLNLILPELEHLPAGPTGEAPARAWFEKLLARFVERGLSTPAQQKNRVVDARNAIRARFGDDHPSLAYVGFDEQTWQAINLPTHDRTEARNENQRLLRHPEKIVARAAKLLQSPRFEDLAVGLGLTVGRRISELLDGHARLEPATAWSVVFTGQRKHRGEREDFSFEVPTLAPAADVLAAWQRLLVMLGDQALTPQEINQRYGHAVNAAADRHFRGLVPPRLPPAPKSVTAGLADDPHGRERRGDALYLHLFRAVYATVAVHWFCPPKVNRLVFKAEIQGHRQILKAQGAMRRSYTASRHYDDYQIADATGHNIDGRQGIKLGKLPGVEVLRAFQAPARRPKPKPAIPPTEEATDSLPPSPPPNLPPTAMDPAPPPTAHDAPRPAPESLTPTPATGTTSATAADSDVPKTPPTKKPRPVTYRIYPVDRPRLDAFRTDPKQSQADNLQGVIDLLENAGAAIQAQDQLQAQLQGAQTQLQVAQTRVAEAEQSRDQARQEAQAERGQREGQEKERQRLQEALAQERARAAAAPPAAASPVGQAVLARELLAMATEAGCPPALQGRLIALATQALGGQGHLERRQDVPTTPPSTTKGDGGARKAPKPAADPARFGPLFAGMASQPVADAGGKDASHGPVEGRPVMMPGQPAGSAAPAVEAAAPSSESPARDAQEPPGAAESSAAPATVPRPVQRRGGAAEKLGQALAAVLAHNQAQTSRERKWAVTESALARLTGCFRPAVRGFFAEHAQQIEAHNLQHHLLPGLNAARGKKGETIEAEVRWRELEASRQTTADDGDEQNGEEDEAQEADER